MVQKYKYLGTTIDQKLTFKPNSKTIYQMPEVSLLPSKMLLPLGSPINSKSLLVFHQMSSYL